MSDSGRFGHDPLAWLREEEPETEVVEPVEAGPDEAAPEAAPQASSAEDDPVLVLPEQLHISEVESLKDRLLPRLADAGPIVVDGSAVERADGASLQLLCAFVRTAQERGIGIQWQGRSAGLTEAATTLGLHGQLFE